MFGRPAAKVAHGCLCQSVDTTSHPCRPAADDDDDDEEEEEEEDDAPAS